MFTTILRDQKKNNLRKKSKNVKHEVISNPNFTPHILNSG